MSARGDPADQAKARPFEGPEYHDEHHADQGGDRDHLDQSGGKQDEGQQEQRRADAGQAPAAPGIDVDQGLADHGATTHAAEQPIDCIGDTLAHAFAVAAAAGLCQFIDQRQGQQ